MTNDRESDYYLRISIYNSHKNSPVFNWSQSKGNIALGIAIAREEVERKINATTEHDYSINIKLRNDKDNRTVFEVNNQRGNIRKTLDSANDFVKYKLGFDLVAQVKKAVAGEE
jgi:hypothetical protein